MNTYKEDWKSLSGWDNLSDKEKISVLWDYGQRQFYFVKGGMSPLLRKITVDDGCYDNNAEIYYTATGFPFWKLDGTTRECSLNLVPEPIIDWQQKYENLLAKVNSNVG